MIEPRYTNEITCTRVSASILTLRLTCSGTLRHNELRGNIGEMLEEVTNDVRIDAILQPLTGEEQSISGDVSVEVRADISARGFWCRGQRAFL